MVFCDRHFVYNSGDQRLLVVVVGVWLCLGVWVLFFVGSVVYVGSVGGDR
jgi:hypothetical protein